MKELLLKDERVSHTLKYKFAKFETPYCLGVIAQPVERRSLCNYTGIVIPTHHEFDPRAHPLMHHIFSQYEGKQQKGMVVSWSHIWSMEHLLNKLRAWGGSNYIEDPLFVQKNKFNAI